jgi:uncharacterized protein YbjT (DUF2867 family)
MNSSDRSKILVTGASGRCGGAVGKRLARWGQPFRILTRSPDQPAVAEFVAAGAELFVGDLTKPASLAGACDGVEQLFLVSTPHAGFEAEVQGACNMLVEAARAGVDHLVFLSVLYANFDVPHCATKGRIEKFIVESRLPHTIMRAGYFLESLPNYFTGGLENLHEIESLISPDAPIYWVTVDDIGEACANILRRGRPSNRIYDLASPNPMSMGEAVGLLSRLLAHPLTCTHRPASIRALLTGLSQAGYFDPEEAKAYLNSLEDPDADYHAAIAAGPTEFSPGTLLAELDLQVMDPVTYVRDLARQLSEDRQRE